MRPAYVAQTHVPARIQMAGPWLDRLYEEIRARLLQSLANWCSQRKAVLVLHAWEIVQRHEIVNLLPMIGGESVFLDSVYCEDKIQDGAGQAQLVHEKLAASGGMGIFNAVTSGNAEACLEMRRLVTEQNPGMVSLNDQADVVNLLIKDIVGDLDNCISLTNSMHFSSVFKCRKCSPMQALSLA